MSKEEEKEIVDLETQDGELHPEYKVLAKNSFYSFLNTWGFFIFSILNAFFISKLLEREIWQVYILAYSIVGIPAIILSFLPPGLENATEYYASRYYSLKDYERLKNFLLNAFIVRISFLIPVFFLSLLGFYLLSDILSLQLKDHGSLVFILSPLIIFIGLNFLMNSINKSLNNYKLIVITLLSQHILNISILATFLILYKTVPVEIVAITTTITYIPPFLINLIFNINRILSFDSPNYSFSSFKGNIIETIKYGGYTKTGIFLSQMWLEGQLQFVGLFEAEGLVPGYKIGLTLVDVPKQASIALSSPLIISFSRLDALEEKDKIHKIYNVVLKYNTLLILFFIGLIFFGTDIFLFLVYGAEYLIFSEMIKVFILTFSFYVFLYPLEALLLAEKKVKFIPLIRGIELLIIVPIFLTLLIFFGLIEAVLGLLFSSIGVGLFFILMTIKVGKVQLKVKEIILQYLAFFLSVGISLLLDILFLNSINEVLLEKINLSIISNFNIFTFTIFILLYIISNLVLGIFTHEDIETFQSFLNKESGIHRIFYKFLQIFKKIIKIKKN